MVKITASFLAQVEGISIKDAQSILDARKRLNAAKAAFNKRETKRAEEALERAMKSVYVSRQWRAAQAAYEMAARGSYGRKEA